MLDPADHAHAPAGIKYWNCPDCEGSFFPRGQLALMTQAQTQQALANGAPSVKPRAQAASAVALTLVLAVATLSSLNKFSLQYSAAEASTLPTSGPNVLTLALLALAYIAGTILAVLGRRLPIIIVGWSVIVVCLLGFSVIIFGP